jgi:hypothetical protein
VDDFRWNCVAEVVELFLKCSRDVDSQIPQLHQPEGEVLVLPSEVDNLDLVPFDSVVGVSPFDPEVAIVRELNDKCPFFHLGHRITRAFGRGPARIGRRRH